MKRIFYAFTLGAFSMSACASLQSHPSNESEYGSAYPSHQPDLDFIKKVKFPSEQVPDGKFTEESLPRFLAAAYTQHAVTLPEFKVARCIQAKNIQKKSGFNTAQLFIVTTGCNKAGPSYIIKEATRPEEEAMNLEGVKNIPGLKAISAPHERAGFPTIALPVAFLTADGNEHAVTVMPLAKGVELCDFINAHKKLQSESDKNAVKNAYFALGQELANFRRKFALVHRDLKCANIFVDKKHVTLIDNETVAPSTQEPEYNQYQDIRKVLFGNYLKNETREMRHMLDEVNLSAWYEASFRSFAQGWASAYPRDKRHEALSDLRESFSEPWEGLSVDWNQKQIDEIRAKYITPILDEVGGTPTAPLAPPARPHK